MCNLACYSKKLLMPLLSVITLLLSLNSYAANGVDNLGRADYDLDDNGLIEINDLADLDEIRNNLDGKTLYGSNVGCPNAEDGTVNGGCIGFELTTDLDFDTNGNGKIDSGDDYRNVNSEENAEGWEPVGNGHHSGDYFSAIFEGGEHVIKNLTINRPGNEGIGLFGNIRGAQIENLTIVNSSIIGEFSVGVLVGFAEGSQVNSIGINADIQGEDYVGALIGTVENSQISNVYIVANVQGENYTGGLAGRVESGTRIENSAVSGSVSGGDFTGGLVGELRGSHIGQTLSAASVTGAGQTGGLIGSVNISIIISSYWAKDRSGQATSAGSSETNSYVGLNIEVLQCATSENTDFNSGCVSVDGSGEGLDAAVVLYQNWDPAVWNFGIAPSAGQQLPDLKFIKQFLRDIDSDGILNGDDAFSSDPAAAIDGDNDGMPDSWNADCLEQCLEDTGLILDPLLNDTDNDGASNDIDTDFENDNGKPVLFTAPETMHAAVNTEDGSGFIVDSQTISGFLSQLTGMDMVDPASALGAKAYLNKVELVPDENGIVILPSGLLALDWVIVDSSGNESEPLEQLIYIYPQVRFKSTASIAVEASQAKIIVELTGDSPEYPVTVELNVKGDLSSVVQADLGEGFDLSAVHTVVIESGDDAEALNREARFRIPLIEDNINENDEKLVWELTAVVGDEAAHEFIVLAEPNETHELTVTYHNAIGVLDTDDDGIPNDCDQPCLDLGKVADLDDDNDGVLDEDDAFVLNPAAAIDDDNDDMPDSWSIDCLAQCQADSGLILDPLLNDTDNDGATNDVDTDNGNDNGKPTLLTVPDAEYAAVNTADGSSYIMASRAVDWHISQISAEDVVDPDSALTMKAYLNNVELVRDERGEITLPSGLLAINWVAVDSSGNESEPLEQLVYIYPQVRFKSTTSIIGEASQAEIIVELTGDSPEYPITVELHVDGILSSVVQNDMADDFDLSAAHSVVIEQGDNAETKNREASLRVSVLEDNMSENDEMLVLELTSVVGEEGAHEFISLTEQNEAHELTVTHRNLAPTVAILVLQNNQAVTTIAMDGGRVSLIAVVTDSNGSDTHTYSWTLDGLLVEDYLAGTVTFEPSDFAVGDYAISVTVTDNGGIPLTGSITQKLSLGVVEELPIEEEPEDKAPVGVAENTAGGSSGGGAVFWMLFVLISLTLLARDARLNDRR